jgi:MFS family permease
MLHQLRFSLLAVIALNTLSQLASVLFLRVWGSFVDRFGSKAVLSLSASLYLLAIGGWTFTTLPDRYFLTIPLVVILQIFAGVAAAGVNLTMTTIGLKLAPRSGPPLTW